MRVQEILRSKSARLVTIKQTASLKDASELISRERVGMLLVVGKDGHVAGTLSERDLIGFIAKNDVAAVKQDVASAMTPIIITASPNNSVTDLMRIMTEQRARHLVVYAGTEVVGVISIGDILKSRIAEKDEETAVLRDLACVSRAVVH